MFGRQRLASAGLVTAAEGAAGSPFETGLPLLLPTHVVHHSAHILYRTAMMP